MGKASGGSACQLDVPKQAFNHLYALLLALNLPVSGRYNAMHGLNEIASMLVHMCANKVTFHAAVSELRKLADKASDVPSSQWTLGMLGSPTMEKMERECKRMLSGMIRATVSSGLLLKHCIIAIDEHRMEFTGDKDAAGDNVTGGKPKGGTSHFVTMLTAQVVSGAFTPTVAIERVLGSRGATECLRGVFSAVSRLHLRPRLYLMDRGFFGIRSMKTMEKCSVLFLMPARKTRGVQDALDEFRRGARKRISRYTIKSSDGQFTFNLIIEKRMKTKRGKRQWVYLPFATNVPRHRIDAAFGDVPSAYKQRWGIENGYKAIERVRGPTFSPNFGVRLLLFYTSVMWCNLWYMANATEKLQAAKGGMPSKRVKKIHTTLRMFMLALVDVSRAVLGMDRAQVRRYLDGGG